MKLDVLLKSLPGYKLYGDTQVEIKGVSDDSRNIKRGFAFVAIKGLHVDAHDLIPKAIKAGASVVFGERSFDKSWGEITYVKVKNPRSALSCLASAWYGEPSKKLQIIGVTGTKGKTTTATLIYKILSVSGKHVGLVTSNGAVIGTKTLDTGFHVTNPEPLELQSLLRKMVDAGSRQAVLEITSHGLDQDRLGSVEIDCAVFTNISHEHLDYHKTLDNYKAAKAKLFKNRRVSVLNLDDPEFEYFKKSSANSKIVSYSLDDKKADYSLVSHSEPQGRQLFSIINKGEVYDFSTPFLGDFNLPNILAAVAASREYEVDWADISNALNNFWGIEGRLEEVKNSKGLKIIIDFAHTPDSLEKVLVYLKQKTTGKLISVFGCASERDTLKRPMMGKISTNYADVSIFTAEDPRREGVNKIISEIAAGVEPELAKELDVDQNSQSVHEHVFYKIPERGDAITFAITKVAQPGDTVVLCGKGHEKSMSYNGIEYPWLDKKAVELALRGKILEIKRHE